MGSDMTKPADSEYRGCGIEVQSYRSDGGRWRPKAIVSISDGRTLRLNPVFAPLERTFDTEQDADAYAVLMAQKWVDDKM